MDVLIEKIAEEVHNAWLDEKQCQGFHSPSNCESENHRSYIIAHWRDQERLPTDPKFHKWCEKCHTDMYPYCELSENVKEYDRVTVKAVLEALSKVWSKV